MPPKRNQATVVLRSHARGLIGQGARY